MDFQKSYTEKNSFREFKSRSILNHFIAELFVLADKRQLNDFGKQKKRESYNKLHYFIIENISQSFDAKDISEELGLSIQYLNSLTNEFRNVSLKELVNFYRLEYSRDKLSDTNLTVGSLATDYGFSSVSYYIKKFKKTYGLTPLQCRKKLLDKETQDLKLYHRVSIYKELECFKERPEKKTMHKVFHVSLCVINRSSENLVVFLWEREEIEMFTLNANKRTHMGVVEGEIWLIRNDFGSIFGYYMIPDVNCQIII